MSKFSLDLSDEDQEKFKKIFDLILPKGIDVEEIKKLNKTIREELKNASNRVVCYLVIVKEHQLSLVELRKRFNEKKFNDLRELFWFLELIYEKHNTGRNEFYEKVREEIERTTPSVDASEIVKIVKCHLDYSGFVNRMLFLSLLIFYSPHREKIIEDIKKIKGYEEIYKEVKSLIVESK